MDSKLFTPYRLGPVTLRNRTVRSAAFESMGRDFGPSEELKNYHVSVARGGVGMTTVAYAAVCRSGLSFRKQLWLRPEIVPGLRDLTDAVHREGAACGIQIGHCGNMTHLTTAGQIPIGASSGGERDTLLRHRTVYQEPGGIAIDRKPFERGSLTSLRTSERPVVESHGGCG